MLRFDYVIKHSLTSSYMRTLAFQLYFPLATSLVHLEK